MRIKQINVGDPIDQFYTQDYVTYDMLVIDQDKVADRKEMLRYCKQIYEACPHQDGRKITPMVHVYGSDISWETDTIPYERHCCNYYEKEGDEKIDLEGTLKKFWAEQDRQAEEHLRSLFREVPEQSGIWNGTVLIASIAEHKYDIEISGLGVFRLQGEKFRENVGKMNTITGTITSRKDEYRQYANLIQIINVDTITPWRVDKEAWSNYGDW